MIQWRLGYTASSDMMKKQRILSEWDKKRLNEIYVVQEHRRTVLSILIPKPDPAEKYNAINELCGIASISYLTYPAFHSDEAVRNITRRKIHDLFQLVQGNDLAWLDERIRADNYYYNASFGSQWPNLKAEDVNNIRVTSAEDITLLCILCCHQSGYVREQALCRLADIAPSSAIKMAFIRINDWTANVRVIALSIMEQHIQSIPCVELMYYLPLIDKLRTLTRRNHSQLIDKIESRFNNEDGGEALLRAITEEDFRLARLAFRLSVKLFPHSQRILDMGAAHRDVLIRSWSLAEAVKQLSGDSLLTYLLLACRSQSASLRKKALYQLMDFFPEHSREPLERCLMHKSAGLRATARFYLLQQFSYDIVQYYRAKLDSRNVVELHRAILGLSEVGGSEEWPLIKLLENHISPKLRAAVILASPIHRISEKKWQLKKLQSDCLAEFTAAKKVLLASDDYQAEDIEQLEESVSVGVRGKALREMVLQKCQWQGLKLILQAVQQYPDNEEMMAEIKQWLEVYDRPYWFVKPDAQLLNSIIEMAVTILHSHPRSGYVELLKNRMEYLSFSAA